jgi:hypothetical protein
MKRANFLERHRQKKSLVKLTNLLGHVRPVAADSTRQLGAELNPGSVKRIPRKSIIKG